MNELKLVGDYLNKNSNCSFSNPKLKEVFIRSAYNRYYYSCFLRIKNVIKEIINVEFSFHKDSDKKIKEIYTKTKKNCKNPDYEENKNNLKMLEIECKNFASWYEKIKGIRTKADYYWKPCRL